MGDERARRAHRHSDVVGAQEPRHGGAGAERAVRILARLQKRHRLRRLAAKEGRHERLAERLLKHIHQKRHHLRRVVLPPLDEARVALTKGAQQRAGVHGLPLAAARRVRADEGA